MIAVDVRGPTQQSPAYVATLVVAARDGFPDVEITGYGLTEDLAVMFAHEAYTVVAQLRLTAWSTSSA